MRISRETSKFAQDLLREGLKFGLPLGREQTVAVFLRAAAILQLLSGRSSKCSRWYNQRRKFDRVRIFL